MAPKNITAFNVILNFHMYLGGKQLFNTSSEIIQIYTRHTRFHNYTRSRDYFDHCYKELQVKIGLRVRCVYPDTGMCHS